MDPQLIEKAQQFFQTRLGISFEALLQPVETERPAGSSISNNGVYGAIREARRGDDATLPMGTWTHELKQPDWNAVSQLAVHALVDKTKDLQLAAWLLEAQIHQAGFEAIPACVVLMQSLCERYWDSLYPRIEGDDHEHRANILRWLDDKLLPSIRLLPIADPGRGAARTYNFADCEQARRNEQLRARQQGQPVEGITLQEVQAALVATPTESHAARHRAIADALTALDDFAGTLDRAWGSDAPTFHELTNLLEQIQSLIGAELHRRGVYLGSEADAAAVAPSEDGDGDPEDIEGGGGSGGGPIRDRAEAYRQLAAIADYLAVREPHSPVPYLIRRAVEWGDLNTAQLYQEIFLKFGGQLNVFELLGLEVEKRST